MPFHHLSYPKSVVFMPYFPYIGIVNKSIYSISVLMIPKVNKVLGVEEKTLTTWLHICLSSEKYLVWNLAFVTRWEKLVVFNSNFEIQVIPKNLFLVGAPTSICDFFHLFVAHHVSRIIHHLIIIFGTQM